MTGILQPGVVMFRAVMVVVFIVILLVRLNTAMQAHQTQQQHYATPYTDNKYH